MSSNKSDDALWAFNNGKNPYVYATHFVPERKYPKITSFYQNVYFGKTSLEIMVSDKVTLTPMFLGWTESIPRVALELRGYYGNIYYPDPYTVARIESRAYRSIYYTNSYILARISTRMNVSCGVGITHKFSDFMSYNASLGLSYSVKNNELKPYMSGEINFGLFK